MCGPCPRGGKSVGGGWGIQRGRGSQASILLGHSSVAAGDRSACCQQRGWNLRGPMEEQGCGRTGRAAGRGGWRGVGPPPAAAPALQLFGGPVGPTPGPGGRGLAPAAARKSCAAPSLGAGGPMSEAACLVARPKRACALGSAQNLEPCPKCLEPAELPAAACVAPATGLDSHAAHAEERRPAARRPAATPALQTAPSTRWIAKPAAASPRRRQRLRFTPLPRRWGLGARQPGLRCAWHAPPPSPAFSESICV